MYFIDASRYNLTQQMTGVENYSVSLINELAKIAPDEITLITPKRIALPVPQIVIPFKRLWTQLRLSWKLFANKKIDNLFIPSHLMPIIHPKNTTITIHDVVFKRFPQSYGKLSRMYLDWGTKYAVKHAKKIIVPSETTKKDLVDFYKADYKKISTIPLGFKEVQRTDDKFCSARMHYYGLKPAKYFLFVGRIESKKNVMTLIKAFEKIQDIDPEIKLVLAGKTGVGGEEILKSLKNKNIIVTGYITEADKQALLKKCLCFVFPSVFEGFGLPLLEAMSAGVPIIASKIPTSYEIAKHNALFFKPFEPDTLANLMKGVIKGDYLRATMTARHEETLQKYSWQKCARETLALLKD